MNAQAQGIQGVGYGFLPPHPKAKESYEVMRHINVGDKIEKKNGLSYLSWAWAVDTLLQHDPDANWIYGEPRPFGETLMVFCAVTAFGRTRTAQLPVMDHRNRAIPNPDAFQVNTAMQRALVKAIALHGLGLYIYAGEDLPPSDEPHLDPRGDLGKDQQQAYAYKEWAAKMLKCIGEHANPDSMEAERQALLSCLDVHDSLRVHGDLYIGASALLEPSERAAWKKLVTMAKKLDEVSL